VETALILLAVQGALGAWDTLYYHEWRLRLPSQPHAGTELLLHATRDFLYAVLFVSIGWVAWNGLLGWLFGAILVAEILITLWDFLEEDRTRKLPPGERVGHAIMGIVYGVFLAYLLPEVWRWLQRPTGFTRVDHGALSWLLTAMGAGVFLSGLRDLAASRRLPSTRLEVSGIEP
jgi:hypothetical protein